MTKNWGDHPAALRVWALLHYLDTVGDADAIAARLSNLGMLGHCGIPDDCPVQAYVAARLPDLTRVRVTPTALRWDGPPGGRTELLPRNVRSFVRRFDQGRYPELLAYAVAP